MLLKFAERIDWGKQSNHDLTDVHLPFSLLCAFPLDAHQNLLLFGYDMDIKDIWKPHRAKGNLFEYEYIFKYYF